MRNLALGATLAFCLTAGLLAQNPVVTPNFTSPAFESYVELLRQQAGIPAISGALLQDGEVVWEQGLGFADQDARIAARPDTPYLIADISETFASVLLLQCVEQRRLHLDEQARDYGVEIGGTATLRQLLSHTSTGSFAFEPAKYALLTRAVEYCAPQPYRKSVAHRLFERLAMIDSVPGRDMRSSSAAPPGLFDEDALARYARSLDRLAVPYRVDRKGRATRQDVPVDGINAATGLVSTVRDLARFDAALDSGVLLTEETLDAAWSPARAADGTSVPMGLGWFVQTYRGVPVVWQFGVIPNAYSALIVKVPSRSATMILLANSDGLAIPFELQNGDVTRSLFATVFLRMLI